MQSSRPRTKGRAAGTAGAPRGEGEEPSPEPGAVTRSLPHARAAPALRTTGARVQAGPGPARQPKAAGGAGMAEPREGAPRYLGVAVPKEKPPTAPPPAPAVAVEPRVPAPKEKPADMAAVAGAAGTGGKRSLEPAARAGWVGERVGAGVAAPQPRMAPAATCGASGGTERADGRRPRSPPRARRGAPRDSPVTLKATATRGTGAALGDPRDGRVRPVPQHGDWSAAQTEIGAVSSQHQETLLEAPSTYQIAQITGGWGLHCQ